MKISVNHLPQLLLVALMLSGCASTPDSAPSEAATSDKATSSPTSSMLSFYSAGKIQQYCSRIGQVTSDPVALQEAGVCIGYISGIVDREAILVIQGEKDPGFCIPAGVSTQEIVTV